MLCGIPCSGKSSHVSDTLIAEYPDAVVLSTDRYVEQYAKVRGKSYVEVFDEAIGPAGKQLESDLIAAVSAGLDIIWDQTNLTRKVRTRKLAKVPKTYVREALCFHIDRDTALLRNSNRCGKFVPRRVIMQMADTFTPPADDEGFNRITHLCH